MTGTTGSDLDDGYIEIWREDVTNPRGTALGLRLLVRDTGAPSTTNLGGLEIDLVGPGETPHPESGVWVPPAARAAFIAWCRSLPESPALPLAPGGRAPSISGENG